jgi:hypothetical protein
MAVLSALHAGRALPPPFPQEDTWYSFLLETVSTTEAIVQLEGLDKQKINRIISSVIKPATFRHVV